MTYYNLYNGYSNDPGSLLSLAFRTTAISKSGGVQTVKLFGKESYDEGYLTGFGAGIIQSSPSIKVLAVGEKKVRLFKTYESASSFLGFNPKSKGGITNSVFGKRKEKAFVYTGKRNNKNEKYKLFRSKDGNTYLDPAIFEKNVDLNSKDLNKIYFYDNTGKNVGKSGLAKSRAGKLFNYELIDDLDD